MTATHSPAPWFANEDGPTEAARWKIRDRDGRLVATLRSETRGDIERGSVAEANAILFIGAPDLLSACRRVIARASANQCDGRTEDWTIGNDDMRALRAAVQTAAVLSQPTE